MQGWRRGCVVAAALLAMLATASPAAASHIYRSPGYKGTRRLPHTLPPAIPTPIPLGTGEKPQVLVDAAGTAHIIWNESRGNDADAIHYCRLKRGATSCDVSQLLVPDGPTGPGADPRFNSEFGTPRIFAVGNQVAIVTNRYPNPFIAPDGSSPGRSTFLFISNDGGAHFDPGVIVGTNEDTGEPTVFGPSDTERIGLISDTETAGTFFQEITGAKYETRAVNLANDGVSTSLAPVGTSVVAAINDLNDQIHVRQWNGQGDIYDTANWSETTVPGDDPKIVGGPAGTFLMSHPAAGSPDRSLDVRPVGASGTTFGTPRVLPGSSDAGLRDLFEDDSGRLLASYRINDTELMQTSSTDHATWSKPLVQRRAPSDTEIAHSDMAAAADGGGFTVDQESPTLSEGPIVAASFGNQAATGKPGLGNQPGGAAPPDVVDKCARVEFAAVDIQLPEGCLLGVKGKPDVKVAEGTFKLNGLEIVPDPGSKILLNARAHTIDTVGMVRVELNAPDIPTIVLYHNELHIALGAEAKDAKNDGSVAGCSGQKLAGFDGGADLLGFPISGSIDVYLSQDSACIPVSLALPAVFGGIRGSAVLKANNADGLVVDSLEIDVDQAYVGPVLVEGVKVSYKHETDEWRGSVDKVGVPPQPGGLALKGSVVFKRGKFVEGSIDIRPIWPGIPLGPWPAYLSHIGGAFGVDPVFIEADVGVGIIQAPPASYVFEINGQFRITFSDPVTFELHGQGAIYGFQIATVDFLLNTDGFVRLKGGLKVHLGPLALDADVETFIDVPSGSFSAGGAAGVCIIGLCPSDAEFVISNRGIGACVHFHFPDPTPDAGVGYKWGAAVPKPFFGDCDITEYKVPLPPGAPPRVRGAQAGTQRFQVAKGTKVVDLALDGSEGQAPKVTLISPSGQRIDPSTDLHVAAPAYAYYPASGGSSIVGIMKPAAGTWQVVPQAGSVPITHIEQARDATPPEVAGSVGGKGRKRLFSYRASTGQGLKTTFFEQGPMGARKLGVAKGKRGTIHFAPADGPRGKRTIQALVERNGIPRLRKSVASYVAPGPVHAGRVKKVRLTRHRKTVRVTWSKASGAAVYAVRIDLPDGRRVLRVTRSRKVTFHGAPRDGHVTVTVAARNRAGRPGRPAKATR